MLPHDFHNSRAGDVHIRFWKIIYYIKCENQHTLFDFYLGLMVADN